MSVPAARSHRDVIIPTYNDAGDLMRRLNSLAAQTLRDLEIIVVDDSSAVSVHQQCSGDQRA